MTIRTSEVALPHDFFPLNLSPCREGRGKGAHSTTTNSLMAMSRLQFSKSQHRTFWRTCSPLPHAVPQALTNGKLALNTLTNRQLQYRPKTQLAQDKNASYNDQDTLSICDHLLTPNPNTSNAGHHAPISQNIIHHRRAHDQVPFPNLGTL